eukprot:30834-Pelagococcus_subviridis.AAC.8
MNSSSPARTPPPPRTAYSSKKTSSESPNNSCSPVGASPSAFTTRKLHDGPNAWFIMSAPGHMSPSAPFSAPKVREDARASESAKKSSSSSSDETRDRVSSATTRWRARALAHRASSAASCSHDVSSASNSAPTESSDAVGSVDAYAAILGVARFGAVAQCRRTPMRSEAVSDQEEFAEEDAAAAADAAGAFSFGSSARRSSSGTPISRCLRVAIERATSCAPSTHSATD